MDGQTVKWMNEQNIDRQTGRLSTTQMNGLIIGRQTDRWIEGGIEYRLTDGQLDGKVD